MLAVGTSYENYHAVWVKNEWSRYIQIVAKDKNKYLIPCYRGLDPGEDLPREFAHLQGQDMGKVGAMADLLRGIEKLLHSDPKIVIQTGSNVTTASLLKRAYLFLEDQAWDSANEYCEKVLDIDPENGQAYLGKLLAEFRISKEEALGRYTRDFTAGSNYHKALRFGDERVRTLLDNARKDQIYHGAIKILNQASEKPAYQDVAARLRAISGWRDANTLLEFCQSRIREIEAQEISRLDNLNQETKRRKKRAKKLIFLTVLFILAAIVWIPFTGLWEDSPEISLSKTLKATPLGIPQELSYTISGDITVHSFTEQLLSSGSVQYTLEFTAQQGLCVSAFNPPDADLFLHQMAKSATGKKQLWTFEVPADDLAKTAEMTVRFSDNDDNSFAFISAHPRCFDSSLLPIEENGNVTSEALQYSDAAVLEATEDYALAAIAFGKLGYYKDAKARSLSCWDKVAVRQTISAGSWHTVGVKSDGSVLVADDNRDAQGNKVYGKPGPCDVGEWANIIAVSAGGGHTVGLKANGTVVATGLERKACAVDKWRHIVAIAAGESHTVGLKSDGTVVATGDNTEGACNVETWENIVAIAAGRHTTLGLTVDGTVVVAGWFHNVVGWKDIVAISAGWGYAVGVKKDGTAVASCTISEDNRSDIGDWTDLVAISGRSMHTVGLKSDGTVVAAGLQQDGQCRVDQWKDIVSISTNGRHTVALRSDGTVVACGSNLYGRCNVSNWKDIKLPQ